MQGHDVRTGCSDNSLCDLPILLKNPSCCDRTFVPVTGCINLKWFEFVGEVPKTK